MMFCGIKMPIKELCGKKYKHFAGQCLNIRSRTTASYINGESGSPVGFNDDTTAHTVAWNGEISKWKAAVDDSLKDRMKNILQN